ncbi:hypothetical protein V9K67_16380 [Paraflavisolibacter sp. H34]|uniref:hypothetical protein n=1 Tax=Huijunlia imazamoxiresistens TaxID=3127457 RepID=UPI0030171398
MEEGKHQWEIFLKFFSFASKVICNRIAGSGGCFYRDFWFVEGPNSPYDLMPMIGSEKRKGSELLKSPEPFLCSLFIERSRVRPN